jgi:hypothetical protein
MIRTFRVDLQARGSLLFRPRWIEGKSSFLECLILEPTEGRNGEYRRFGYLAIGDFGTMWWWANIANPIGAKRSGAREEITTRI